MNFELTKQQAVHSENGDYVYFDMSNKSIRNKYLSEQNRIMEDKF